MIMPSLPSVIDPVVDGFLLGHETLCGILAGATVAGFLLALLMANAGGTRGSTKKHIGQGNLGDNGSGANKAAVVGTTIDDPFKDTFGPSMSILTTLATVVSLVFAPLL